MNGCNRKKTNKTAMDEICERVKELLRGFTDEELGWLAFDVDNPDRPRGKRNRQGRSL